MPVSTLHKQYQTFHPKWLRCRNTIEGGDAVKIAADYYLPRLQDQTLEEYSGYVKRANFYPAASRTKDGLHGFIFRKEPTQSIPDQLQDIANDMSLEGIDIKNFAKNVVDEVLEVGRYGSLVDWSEDENRPVCVSYSAEDILNWRQRRVGGKAMLSMLVLRETALVEAHTNLNPNISAGTVSALQTESGAPAQTSAPANKTGPPSAPNDPFVDASILQYRVYWLLEDETGNPYVQAEVWQTQGSGKRAKEVLVQTLIPERRGQPLDRIPFVFHGPKDTTVECIKPPLIDLVDVNLSHYRSSADIEHAAHFTALPTLFAIGFPKDTMLRVGSSVALVTDQVGAQVGFVEYTGQGITPLATLIASKEAQMAAIGARLLEAPKSAVEAADTLEMRQSGEKSVLAQISDSCSSTIVKCLQWCAWWIGVADDPEDIQGIEYTLNTDYFSTRLSPQEQTSLMLLWQSGGISKETLHNNLQRGDIIGPQTSFEAEQAAIQSGMGPDGVPVNPDPKGAVEQKVAKFTIRSKKPTKVAGNVGSTSATGAPVDDATKAGTSGIFPTQSTMEPVVGMGA